MPVSFEYADESDGRRYPIPPNAPIEGGRSSGGDRHVLLVDRSRCRLYELYSAYPQDGGSSWRAGSGAIWNLRSNRLRPRGWTSADAAGLPILPGLARYDEVKRGRHRARAAHHRAAHPAARSSTRRGTSPRRSTDASLPAMGQRVRLKRSFSLRAIRASRGSCCGR